MRVSVGIPFYNGAATLPDAIRSVFAQSFEDWELILVDDGSRDDSLAIAQSIRDSRVRVISDGMNRGVAYRHNQIADAARGEYIAKLDDDDIMRPDRLERQVRYLDDRPEVDVVTTSVYTITLNGTVSGVRKADSSQLTHKNIVSRSMLIQPTVLARATWFKRNHYELNYVRAEDHELWARTFSYSSFRADPEPLTFYREGRTRSMRKYVLSGRSDRRIFWKYGRAVASWPTIVGWHALSSAKTLAYCGLWLLGLQNLALSRTRAEAASAELSHAQRILDSVLSTPVPGLPERISREFDRVPEVGSHAPKFGT